MFTSDSISEVIDNHRVITSLNELHNAVAANVSTPSCHQDLLTHVEPLITIREKETQDSFSSQTGLLLAGMRVCLFLKLDLNWTTWLETLHLQHPVSHRTWIEPFHWLKQWHQKLYSDTNKIIHHTHTDIKYISILFKLSIGVRSKLLHLSSTAKASPIASFWTEVYVMLCYTIQMRWAKLKIKGKNCIQTQNFSPGGKMDMSHDSTK